MVDNAAWGAIGIALTVLAGLWTWYAFRNRGLAAGVRGVSFVLLALAAWLTNTLKLLGRIADAIADWAVRLVFSPTVWVGIGLAVVAVLVFFVSLRLPGGRKERTAAEAGPAPRQVPGPRSARTTGRGDGGVSETLGDDADDITAILRKHGIS